MRSFITEILQSNLDTWLFASKFNFFNSLRFTNPISFLDFFMSWRTFEICTPFCYSGIFLPLAVLPFLWIFSCLCLLGFHSSKIVDLRRLNYRRIIYIRSNWKKLDLNKWWINFTRKLISFFDIPLNLKQAIKLNKNRKAWFLIFNPNPAVWFKERIC